MSKNQFPVALLAILAAGFIFGHILGLILAAAGLLASYGLSVWVHPRTRHTGFRSCGGSGELRGSIFTWAHRKCPGKVCQGGRQIRWGAGHFGASHIQSEYARAKRANIAAKDGNRWR